VRFEFSITDHASLKRRVGAWRSGLFASFLLGLTAGPAASAAVAAGSAPVTITWKMAERFGRGYDLNQDGRPDLPNSYEYVNPGGYEVQLAAEMGAIGASAEYVACVWTIESDDGATRVRAIGPKPIVRLPQGRYTATVTVQRGDGWGESARETIRVKDILIVALGDSMACGEGNPETPARWEPERNCAGLPRAAAPCIGFGLLGVITVYASRRSSRRRAVWARWAILGLLVGALFDSLVGFDWAFLGRREPPTPALWANGGPGGDRPRVTPAGVLPPASVLHIRAHRSTHSAPAQFAMQLEAADPHTSITFVCLAGTGARTVDLCVPGWSGQNRTQGPGPVLPAQFDELRAIVGSRPVDILVLSIGINDCRTFTILRDLIRGDIRSVDPLCLLAAYPTRKQWAAAAQGNRREPFAQDAGLIYDFDELAAAGLAAARDEIGRLGRSIAQDPRLSGAEVYLLEYPDPTRVESGATGVAILDDLVPGLRINRRELDLFRERLLRPLNRMHREAAERQGWHYVGGIFDAFRSHGYPARETWFFRTKESEQLQGPRLWLAGYLRGELSSGMLHPNHRGHQLIADRLYQRLLATRTCREPNRVEFGAAKDCLSSTP
jgi:hypothetical protein